MVTTLAVAIYRFIVLLAVLTPLAQNAPETGESKSLIGWLLIIGFAAICIAVAGSVHARDAVDPHRPAARDVPSTRV